MTLSEFREDLGVHKTRMNGLSCGEESMTIYSAVLIGCQRVTDRRTDVKPIAITCFSIADARKNERIRIDYRIESTEIRKGPFLVCKSRTVECQLHLISHTDMSRTRYQLVQPVNNCSQPNEPITGIRMFYAEISIYFTMMFFTLITYCLSPFRPNVIK